MVFSGSERGVFVGNWHKEGSRGAVVKGVKVPFIIAESLENRWLSFVKIKKL